MTLKAKSTFFTIHNSLLLSATTQLNNSNQNCKGNTNSDYFSLFLLPFQYDKGNGRNIYVHLITVTQILLVFAL